MGDYSVNCACGTVMRYGDEFAPEECDECIEKRIRADERVKVEREVVAWLRAEAERWGGGRDVAAVGLETAANVIERGEHWTT